MPRVIFTPVLERHLECPTCEVEGTTVGSALGAVFRTNPRLRGYVLDDQDRLRQHINIFVDGRVIADRMTLSDPVTPATEVYVMQALSGG